MLGTLLLAIRLLAAPPPPAPNYTYVITNLRKITNVDTGAVVWVCSKGQGGEPLGTFFNVADSCGASCIFDKTQVGTFLYVEMCQGGDFRLTSYWQQAVLCDPFAPIPDGVRAHRYEVYDAATLAYAGHADSLPGPVLQYWMGPFICITPTPAATPTSGPSPSTATPTRTATVTPTGFKPTVTPGCPGPIVQPPGSPTCVCVPTGQLVPCPGPVTATPTPAVATPAPTATLTPTGCGPLFPSDCPTRTPDVKPSRTLTPMPVTKVPTFTPTVGPTCPPCPTVCPTCPAPTPTVTSVGSAGCSSKKAGMPGELILLAGVLAASSRRLRH